MSYSTAFETFVIFTLMLNVYASFEVCPNISTSRCSCFYKEEKGPHHAECRGLEYRTLQRVLRGRFKTFTIVGSKLDAVDRRLFSSMTVNRLEFKFSEVKRFELFSGLYNLMNLNSLVIDSVRVKYWRLSSLDKTEKYLRELILIDCPEENVNDPRIVYLLPNNMTSIKINWCRMKSEQMIFGRFSNLQSLDLSNNLITELKRGYFPNPAINLSLLSLSQNPIKSLPDGIFTNMPKLKKLFLETTSIATFSYVQLHPLLQHLETIQIAHNPFHCDCYNSWILSRVYKWTEGYYTCASPNTFKGQRLEDLTPKEICQPEERVYKQTMDEYCSKEPNYTRATF